MMNNSNNNNNNSSDNHQRNDNHDDKTVPSGASASVQVLDTDTGQWKRSWKKLASQLAEQVI